MFKINKFISNQTKFNSPTSCRNIITLAMCENLKIYSYTNIRITQKLGINENVIKKFHYIHSMIVVKLV